MKAKINRGNRTKAELVDELSGIDPSKIKLEGLEGPKMTLYEINQAEMINVKPLSASELEQRYKEVIWDYVYNKCPSSKYFMLLCNHISYYTLFVNDDRTEQTLNSEFFNCVEWVGDVLSIEYNETNGVPEIWIKTPEGNCHCMYFFTYDSGVIPFRKD
jgi:hypothetical protein